MILYLVAYMRHPIDSMCDFPWFRVKSGAFSLVSYIYPTWWRRVCPSTTSFPASESDESNHLCRKTAFCCRGSYLHSWSCQGFNSGVRFGSTSARQASKGTTDVWVLIALCNHLFEAVYGLVKNEMEENAGPSNHTPRKSGHNLPPNTIQDTLSKHNWPDFQANQSRGLVPSIVKTMQWKCGCVWVKHQVPRSLRNTRIIIVTKNKQPAMED